MRELKVIDVDKMADVRSLSGQFYRKSEVDDVIEYLQNQLSACARDGAATNTGASVRKACPSATAAASDAKNGRQNDTGRT